MTKYYSNLKQPCPYWGINDNRKELSYGNLAILLLTYIVSEADHRCSDLLTKIGSTSANLN